MDRISAQPRADKFAQDMHFAMQCRRSRKRPAIERTSPEIGGLWYRRDGELEGGRAPHHAYLVEPRKTQHTATRLYTKVQLLRRRPPDHAGMPCPLRSVNTCFPFVI